MLVSERFVEQHLQGEAALGQRVRFGANDDTAPEEGWITFIGVVPNVPQGAIEEEEFDAVAYRPLRANPGRSVAVLVRAAGDVSA